MTFGIDKQLPRNASSGLFRKRRRRPKPAEIIAVICSIPMIMFVGEFLRKRGGGFLGLLALSGLFGAIGLLTIVRYARHQRFIRKAWIDHRCLGCGRPLPNGEPRACDACGESPYCLRCGYNLTGNSTGRCPECGGVVEWQHHENAEHANIVRLAAASRPRRRLPRNCGRDAHLAHGTAVARCSRGSGHDLRAVSWPRRVAPAPTHAQNGECRTMPGVWLLPAVASGDSVSARGAPQVCNTVRLQPARRDLRPVPGMR